MKDLTLHEIEQGMTRLLEGVNAPKLALLFCAAIYQMMLVALLARIRALPEELRGRPVAWLLKETDILRDDWLRAIWHLKEAMRFCPKPTDSMATAIDLIINVFALSPEDIKDTYAENHSKATTHAKHLNTQGQALAAIPTPDGGQLNQWFEEFVAAGKKSGDLLFNRSEKLAEVSQRSEAGLVRLESIGLLNEFRTVVRREVDHRPELPRTLENELFGMFDTLQTLAEQRNQEEPTDVPIL